MNSTVAESASVKAKLDAKAGNILAHNVNIMTEKGSAQTTGTIKAECLKMKGDSIKLDSNGVADHQLGKLTLETKRLDQIYDIINGEDMFKKLQIRDELNLEVTDQSLILTNYIVGTAALSIKAKKIDVFNADIRRDKGVTLESRDNMTVRDSSIISVQKNVKLKSEEGRLNIHKSTIKAGKDVNILLDSF